MITEELRDWHAIQKGWKNLGGGYWTPDKVPSYRLFSHPFPQTLDGAASAMPEGWQWTRTWRNTAAFSSKSVLTWSAWTTGKSCEVFDTKDEIHDRYLLAKLAKEAINANSR